jgi:hypothetical protein
MPHEPTRESLCYSWQVDSFLGDSAAPRNVSQKTDAAAAAGATASAAELAPPYVGEVYLIIRRGRLMTAGTCPNRSTVQLPPRNLASALSTRPEQQPTSQLVPADRRPSPAAAHLAPALAEPPTAEIATRREPRPTADMPRGAESTALGATGSQASRAPFALRPEAPAAEAHSAEAQVCV